MKLSLLVFKRLQVLKTFNNMTPLSFRLSLATPKVQWVASLIGIILPSVVLCCFSKCAYATAGALYIVGVIVDVASVVLW